MCHLYINMDGKGLNNISQSIILLLLVHLPPYCTLVPRITRLRDAHAHDHPNNVNKSIIRPGTGINEHWAIQDSITGLPLFLLEML